jgi:hypothetical protein
MSNDTEINHAISHLEDGLDVLRVSVKPCRRVSLGITNVEQAILWLRDELENGD